MSELFRVAFSKHPGCSLLVPLHLDGRDSDLPHWLLLLLRPDASGLFWVDSADGCIRKEHPLALEERERRVLVVRGALAELDTRWARVEPAPWTGWPLGVPQQTNSTDCGVYAMEFARVFVDGQPHSRAVRNGDVRRRIAVELADAWCRERLAPPRPGWACPRCTLVNEGDATECGACAGAGP
jgi:hypothetical protein